MYFKKLVQTFLLFLWANIAFAQSEFTFHHYGGNAKSEIAQSLIALPSNAGFVIAGSQSTDGYVVKTNAQNNITWEKTIPNTSITTIVNGSNDNEAYVAGKKSGKAFISKINLNDGSETQIWLDTITSEIKSAVKTNNNKWYFTGFRKTIDDELLPFVVILENGAVTKQDVYELSGYQPFSITSQANNDVWIAGKIGNENNTDSTFLIKYGSPLIIKKMQKIAPNEINSLAANTNHIFMAGRAEPAKTGYIRQFNASGDLLKTVNISAEPNAIIANDTSVIVVGNVGKNIFFSIYDQNLNLKKTEEITPAPQSAANAVVFSGSNFTMAGSVAFTSENKADKNFLLLKILKPKPKYAIKGRLVVDKNCDAASNTPIPFWQVRGKVNNIYYFTFTDKDGNYTLNTDFPGNVQLEITPTFGWQTCAIIDAAIDNNGIVNTAPNIVAKETLQTPLEVQISTPYLINGQNATYLVKVLNKSAKAFSNPSLKIIFSPELKKESETLPSTDSNDTLIFNWAKIDSFKTIDFQIVRKLDDKNPNPNKSYCAIAQTFPFNFAKFARYKITGKCKAATNQIEFEVKNTGSDTLDIPPSWIIIEEDLIMRSSKNTNQSLKNLKGGESQILVFDKNKKDVFATYAMVLFQSGNNVFGAYSTARIESCGLTGSPGLPITTFSSYDEDKSYKAACAQAETTNEIPKIARLIAYPKGEKVGVSPLPEVYDSITIKYELFVPNLGSDIANSMTVKTLCSKEFSLSQLEFGVRTNDPTSVKILNNNSLEMQFDNLNLKPYSQKPDSSYLYYTYSIRVPAKNNDSLIFTNNTSFRFGYSGDFTKLDSVSRLIKKPKKVTTTINTIPFSPTKISVYPNPAYNGANISVTVPDTFIDHTFYLFDAQGRLRLMIPIQQNTFQINTDDLPDYGFFNCQIRDKSQKIVATGKVIVQ